MKKLTALICLFVALQATVIAAPLQLLSPPTKQLDPPAKKAVEQLLDAKWKKGSANKRESETIFAEDPHDKPEVLVAYVLNRINHNEVDQGLEIAKEFRLRFKQNWDGRILDVWLLTLTDQYDVAIVQMRSLKKQLDAAQKENRLTAAVSQSLYRRLGRLIGYLEGPVVEKVNPQLLADTTAILEQNITPQTQQAFTLARQFVKTEYDQLVAQQVAYQNKELVKVAAVNDVEKEQLEKETELNQDTRAQLVPQLEKLRDEERLQTSLLEQQIGSAQGNLRTISQTAYNLEQQLAFLYADLYTIDRRFFNTFAIENQIYQVELELTQQRNAAANQAGIVNGLSNELFGVRQNFQRQIGQAQRNLRRIEVSQKRNNKQLQKIAAGPKIAGGKTQSLASRRTALKTYDGLPLELYRQELLDAVRALDAGR